MKPFDGWSDEQVEDFLKTHLYEYPRKLSDGSWCGLSKLMFTWSVCMDIDEFSPFKYRWCFEDFAEAMYFLQTAEDFDEVPERRESLKGHRYKTAPLLVLHDERGFPRG